MIRGKKNYLPTCQLQMGFGLLFKLDEFSFEKRQTDFEKKGEEAVTEVAEAEREDADVELSLEQGNEEDEEAKDSDEYPDVEVQFSLYAVHD